MGETNHAIARWLAEAGWSETYINLAVKAIIILGILVVAYAAAVLFRRLVVPLLQKISARTRSRVGRPSFHDKVMHRRRPPDPAPILLCLLLRLAFGDDPSLLKLLHKGCSIYLIVVTIALLNTFLSRSTTFRTNTKRCATGR